MFIKRSIAAVTSFEKQETLVCLIFENGLCTVRILYLTLKTLRCFFFVYLFFER